MKPLTEYIVALTNLYGIVHKEKVLEVYNTQNDDQIDLSEVDRILADPATELSDTYIETQDDYFVHESILEFDEFDSMMIKKTDKPHFIPSKSELLKYISDGYFERTKQYVTLLNYTKEHFYDGDEEKAENLCYDIHGMCQYGYELQMIFDRITELGVKFEDSEQLNEVVGLISELGNHIRIWENNGYTPQEIFEKFEKPQMMNLPAQPFNIPGSSAADLMKSVGRNDPCPCGSGKKYKKCCLN